MNWNIFKKKVKIKNVKEDVANIHPVKFMYFDNDDFDNLQEIARQLDVEEKRNDNINKILE